MAEIKNKVVFILGDGRAETMALSKLIDSSVLTTCRRLPDPCLHDVLERETGQDHAGDERLDARAMIEAAVQSSPIGVSCDPPIFNKGYRTWIGNRVFTALALMSNALGSMRLPLLTHVPDLIRARDDEIVYVVDAGDVLARVALIERAWPEAFFIHILRHPCALYAQTQAPSKTQAGPAAMAAYPDLESLFAFQASANYPLSYEQISRASPAEQFAYRWMLLNEKTKHDMASVPGYLSIRFEDLGQDLRNQTLHAFHHIELQIGGQTTRFINEMESAAIAGQKSGLLPLDALDAWRDELDQDTVERIKGIVCHSDIGRFYFNES